MLDEWMRRFLRPNPTRAEVPGHPPGVPAAELDVAAVRVTCHTHRVCLYRGEQVPDRGAVGIAAAAGCPAWDGEHGPDAWADCPVAVQWAGAPGAVFDHTDPTADGDTDPGRTSTPPGDAAARPATRAPDPGPPDPERI